MPKVSVTIVNYNSADFIRNCLNSLKAQTFKDFETIIIDNASSDNSAGIIEKEYPDAALVKNKTNTGYCKAQNTAIKMSKGDFILTLNPDVILENNFIEEIVKAALADADAGSAAPKLLKLVGGEKTDIIDSCGHIIGKNRRAKNIGDGEKDTGQYDRAKFIFGSSGAAPLHRKKMLEEIKYNGEYLDEDFVLGYDDVDIDWRAKLKGWKTLYCPTAIAYHMRGASTKKSSREWGFYNYRNRYLMMIKNDSFINILTDFPHLFIYELGMFFSMLMQLQLFSVLSSAIKLLPLFLLKRAELKKNQEISDRQFRIYFD